MRQYSILLAGLFYILCLNPVFGDEAPNIETVVELDLKHYPAAKGDHDAFLYADFVKKRKALAQKLHKAKKLEDATTVLKGLIKHNPKLTLERYDLGAIYYEHALIIARHYEKVSLKLSEITKSGDKAQMKKLREELWKTDRKAKKKASYALIQFKAYRKSRSVDPRPADSIWRCYMLLERYEKAVEALDVVIQWKDLLDKRTKQRYLAIRAQLEKSIEEAKKEKDSKKEPTPQKDKEPKKKEAKDD